ncbi:hypothetical protein DL89DRAFT_267644 [Linderina pennispora]|uniref:Uncharacterized protein n=1 Tax=Linderina pennispora TaxID=61395 RepID=A0A1Y1W7J3_9FUNG|nr:uncharacterized protein DL89DRAFT_267644 [Linderina pennispora]ORX69412.1 hypothetical protein DL89DRAFT_267644 [Linderina pennispora]
MGIREKSDFNLQFVSFSCALLALLFFAAAKNYTLDWRERRVVKRKLKEARKHIEEMAQTKKVRRRSMSFLDEQPEVSDDSSAESKRWQRRRWSSGACRAQLQSWSESEGESDDSKNQTPQTSRRRRGWKRFIAALPLMPLATAYVVVRLGWDVFELLVFCTIDALLNAAAHSLSTVRTAAATMHTIVTGLVTRLNLKQRMVDAAILITETTVVWAFNTGLPAIGSFISYLLARCTDFGCWWQETGGPVLRDFTELAVLDYIVPACSATAAGISATYWRVCWLARQIWKAARILSRDLMCDLVLLWQWIGAVSGWLKHHRHWLRPVLLMLLPSSERIRMVKAFVSGVMAPWICTKAVLAYERAWRPAFRVCMLAGDCAIQFLVGSAILLFSRIQTSTVWARLVPLLKQSKNALIAGIRLVKHFSATVIPGVVEVYLRMQALLAKYSWLIQYSHAAYSRAREMILPRMQAMAAHASQLWAFTVSYMGRLASGILVARLRRIAWTVATSFFRHLCGAWQGATVHMSRLLQRLQPLRLLAKTHAWILSSELVSYVHHLASSYWQQLLVHISTIAAGLWPIAIQGWRDSIQVLVEMCRQLAAAVDLAVATIGDLIVDFARRSTVHSNSLSGRTSSVYGSDGLPEKKKL